MPGFSRHPALSYAVAIAATAIVVFFRWAAPDALGQKAPIVPFILPVVLAGWWGGLRPGLIATALGILAIDYLFLPPVYSFGVESAGDAAALAFFALCGTIVSVLCEAMHSARRRLDDERLRLLASDEFHRLISDLTADFAWMARVDENHRVVLETITDGFTKLLGYSPDEWRCTGWRLALHPDERSAARRMQEQLLAGQSVEGQSRLVGKDGRVVAVNYLTRPIFDRDGRVVRIVGAAQDITERKQAEQALREREQQFTRFTEHLPGLAWMKDVEGRYVYVNDAAAAIFGRPPAELYGKTDDDLFPPNTAAQFKANDRRALESGLGIQVIETLLHDDGVLHSSIVSKFPIPGPDGRPALVGGMAIDITDQRRAEAALRDADRRKDEFLATMAHELRNPLAPIRHAIEILKSKAPVDRDLAYSRDVIDRQVQQMVRLLDDLLDVSRISRNKLELHKQPIKLATVIENAFETSQPLMVASRHQFSVSMPADPVHLDADPVRLAQVFANLLNNAAKYTEPGGQICLRAEREGSDIVVCIRDTGIGISAEMLPRLFEMFSQATPALARSQGGLGIGLALVKGLVELHGGTIEVKSAGQGKGSEFVVRLPVMVQLPPLETPAAPSLDHVASEKKVRILIADDNRDGADSLARMLRILGHETHTVYDGQQAVEQAVSFHPDIILLDIGMPKMNGHDAARHIRQQSWGKDVLLIALTGWGREEDRRRTQEVGFDHHLVKPVDAKALLALLSELPVS
jgi:PAS domain S-box-containing protein